MAKETTGWKRWAMRAADEAVLRLPFLSQFANQLLEKDLALLAAWHFLCRSGVPGDYVELGVFRGETLRNAVLSADSVYKSLTGSPFPGRFFGFDSFRGLPEVASTTRTDSVFRPGEFRGTRREAERTLGRLADKRPIRLIEGWFEETLTKETAKRIGLERVAFANVDCDLYESALVALRFLTPFLQTGSVLYFDDWFSLRGSMKEGEARACAEWLAENPGITLAEYRHVGVNGKMFLVTA